MIDRQIDTLLSAFGAVEIVGSRWCGKTWTAMAHGESIVHLDDPQTKVIAEADPLIVLEGERPHVVDEWQEVPRIWDVARRSIDSDGGKGLFILTGSSSLSKDTVTHSGAGRIARIRMRPMSLYESGESSGDVSLSGLFNGEFRPNAVSTDLREIAGFVCRGGWPGTLSLPDKLHIEIATQYLDTLLTVSVPHEGKKEGIARKLLASLARNLGQAVTYKTIAKDMGDSKDSAENEYTHYLIDTYLELFEDQYFIENLNGWDAPIKSKSRLRTKPKRYFVDPSLTAATLSVTPDRLLDDMQLFGNLFEELCIRDLRIY
ncbi:MAG: AAA family ATPase, partial [Clostridiales Family XIII bacterium]|nr:AAA family ATPase [Clostridiales Family XIII bacterium]